MRAPGFILLAVALLTLAGCGADEDAARTRATERLERGAAVIRADLEARIAACERALTALPAALENGVAEDARRWDAVETVRALIGKVPRDAKDASLCAHVHANRR